MTAHIVDLIREDRDVSMETRHSRCGVSPPRKAIAVEKQAASTDRIKRNCCEHDEGARLQRGSRSKKNPKLGHRWHLGRKNHSKYGDQPYSAAEVAHVPITQYVFLA